MRFATRSISCILAVSFLNFSLALNWAVAAPGDSATCDPKSYSDLVSCADKRSSSIAISIQQLRSAQGLVGIAEQRLNPELNADSVHRGASGSESNATLLFPIRLGGKRSALINEAKNEVERARAVTDLEIQESRLSVMLALYRLSQVKRELSLASETVGTYSKIVGQFEKRPALSPEQDVSLSVFRMASADYRLRLTNLKADEESLYQSLTALTGIPRAALTSNLPPPKQDWRAVNAGGLPEGSPQLRVAIADVQLAKSRLDRAEADAWADLRIGPSVKAVRENGDSNTYVGLGLSIPLPIFSRNAAGKSYGAQRVAEAELTFDQTRRKAIATRDELINRYTLTVQSLRSSLSLDTLSGKHDRIEKQFFKGLVPSALVIEAHRQLFDLEQRRNTSELEALEALGRLLILDNRFNEVIL
jgi:outer membrane protein, heavy metal efflux system